MKKIGYMMLAAGVFASTPVLAVDGNAVLGGALGGGLGAAVGSELGGRNGAIAGSAIGAAVGTAAATDRDSYPVEQRVIYVDEDRHHHAPRGHARGYYGRAGHHRHRHHDDD